MLKMKFEHGHKRFKLGLTLLVILSILLSGGIFLSSYTLIKQIEELNNFILPLLEKNQKVLTEVANLRYRVDRFSLDPAKDSAAALNEKLRELKDAVQTSSLFASEQTAKDKILKAEFSLSSFLNEAQSLSGDAYTARVRALLEKVHSDIYSSIDVDEIERVRSKVVDTANATIIISFCIFFLVGGGLFIGLLIYTFMSRRHIDRLDVMANLAMVDELTKLYNSTYFEERLFESVNRVQRFKSPLALIFLRVELPANMERESKEMIIKEIALRLTKNTRAYDVNARFDGATFASIIHEVGEKEAGIVIKRIKNAVEQKEIVGKIEPHRGVISRLFNLPVAASGKTYATYVRVVIAVELYKDGDVSIEDLINKGAVLLEEAETSKNQVKILKIKGRKKDVKKAN